MSLKIVFFVHCYPPAVGGLEYLSSEIVRILRDAGHQVEVITGQGKTLDSYKTFSNWVDEKGDAKYIHRLSLNFFLQRISNKFLNKLIFISGSFSPWYFGPILHYDQNTLNLIKNADLIIGAGMPTKMFYDAYYFAKIYHKRLVLHPSYHNVSYYNHSIFFQKALSFADIVIYQTPLEKDDLNKNYKLEQKKLKQLTYCPYTEKDWQKAIKKAQLKKKIIKDKIKNNLPIIIGYIGQITLRKNLQFFADFIKTNLGNFKKRKIKVNFLLAGARTNSSTQVEALFTEYAHLVKFVYDFKENDKTKIFNQIDIFINPSKEESLGLVNFEAMYYGLTTYVHFQSAFNSINVLNKDTQQSNLLNIKTPVLRKAIDYQLLISYSQNYYVSDLNELIVRLCYNKNYTK